MSWMQWWTTDNKVRIFCWVHYFTESKIWTMTINWDPDGVKSQYVNGNLKCNSFEGMSTVVLPEVILLCGFVYQNTDNYEGVGELVCEQVIEHMFVCPCIRLCIFVCIISKASLLDMLNNSTKNECIKYI